MEHVTTTSIASYPLTGQKNTRIFCDASIMKVFREIFKGEERLFHQNIININALFPPQHPGIRELRKGY